MLLDASTIKGYEVEASDGLLGIVRDLLFEDVNWTVRWVVVDVGHWLADRNVLLPPSAVGPPDRELRRLPTKLTMQQVKDAPDVDTDEPVSRQYNAHIDQYYSWIPAPIGSEGPLSNAIAQPFVEPLPFSKMQPDDAPPGDPHLRSIATVTGYHVHATDGAIGHVENFLLEDLDWSIRYLTVDTKNWWPGEKVLISPHSVQEIDWVEALIRVDLDREKIKHGPRYDPALMVEDTYQDRFHIHHGR